MKTKLMLSFLLVAFLLSLGLASAVDFTLSASSVNFDNGKTSSTFTISTVNASETMSASITQSSIAYYDDGTAITLTASSPGSSFNTSTVTVSAPGLDFTKLTAGKTYTASFVISENATNNKTYIVNIFKDFCSAGDNATDIVITDVDANIDFDSWNPTDDISLNVEVENKNTSKQKIKIEVSLYSVADNSLVKIDGSSKKFTQTMSIADDDSETLNVKFKVSPKLEQGDYRLLVKAYKESSESSKCTSESSSLGSTYYQAVVIEYEDELLLDNIDGPLDALTCSQMDSIAFDFYNLDYGDDEVFALGIAVPELGINSVSENFELSNGDSRHQEFSIKIPANATLTQYNLRILAYHNYQESSDKFNENTVLDSYILKVTGCQAPKNATISADFSSDTPRAVIGSSFTIESVIKNTGASAASYSVEVTGNSDWSAVSIDPNTAFTLEPGESKQVDLYFDVNSDADEGNETFKIRVLSGTTVISEASVQIPLEKGLTMSGITKHLKDNWYIYTIILVNLILIIAIVIIVVKMASRRKSD